MVLQHNSYDNNTLLLVAYMLICCFVADAVCNWLSGEKIAMAARVAATIVLVIVCGVSAVLTMAREVYSGTDAVSYQLYDKDMVDLCAYIEENTAPNSVVLTANNHNNAVASLTGRNIVCGTSSFLYYHGLDYTEREYNLANMYNEPETYEYLFRQYDVDYILVSGAEYGTFPNLNETAINNMYPCEYANDSVRLYRVKGAY